MTDYPKMKPSDGATAKKPTAWEAVKIVVALTVLTPCIAALVFGANLVTSIWGGLVEYAEEAGGFWRGEVVPLYLFGWKRLRLLWN